jgi:hypothetical protein
VDPIFGLYGYGCNVAQVGGCYSITPQDGVFKRLNLITQKFHMDLNRDRYTGATVSTTNDYLGFTLENQTPSTAHTTTLTLTGLAAGTYAVSVGGTSAAAVTATSGAPMVVSLSIGTDATYAVQIGTGCGGTTSGTDGGDGLPPDSGGVTTGDAGGGDATLGSGDAGAPGDGSPSGDGASGSDGSGGGSDGDGGNSASNPGSSAGCGCVEAGESRDGVGAAALLGWIGLAFGVARRRGTVRSS